jgi:hypothetical protein
MENLLDTRRRCRRSDQIRHDVSFPLLTLHLGKDRIRFSAGFIQKENIVYTGVLQIFRSRKTDELSRTLPFFEFDQNKWVILGQELTEINLRK